MTAPTFPPRLTRSKVGRRLREAYERVGEAQRQISTRRAQICLLRSVWILIEAAEEQALRDVGVVAAERKRRRNLRSLLEGKQP